MLVFTDGPSATVTVQIRGDEKEEANEVFRIRLSDVVNATLEDDVAEITILDDDQSTTSPSLTIADVAVNEGDTGKVVAGLAVTLSQTSTTDVSFDFATEDLSARADDGDYEAIPTTTRVIPAGQTSTTIEVTVVGDTKQEGDEAFRVVLSNPSGATLLDPAGEVTIRNDDSAPPDVPTVSLEDRSVSEGNSGRRTVSVTATLSAAAAQPVELNFATRDGSATEADNDYEAKTGSVRIAAGETSAVIEVVVIGDTREEPDENFLVELTAATGTEIQKNQAVVTVRNDDAAQTQEVEVSVQGATVSEGNDKETVVQAVLSRKGPLDASVTVEWTTDDGTALAGEDYRAASGQAVFEAGQEQTRVSLTVLGDTVAEPDESFYVRLTSTSTGRIAMDLGEVLILNDDEPPPKQVELRIADLRVDEGNRGSNQVAVVVSLSEPPESPVSVGYATQDASATVANNDYLAVSGTLNFAVGQTENLVRVAVLGDRDVEPDEIFRIALSAPQGARIADGLGEIVIRNDDSGGGGGGDDDGDGDGDGDGSPPRSTVVTQASGRAGATLPLEIHVLNDAGMPVAGALVRWSGELPLLAGSETRANGAGHARQRVRLPNQPGTYEVEAFAPATRQGFLIEILVLGNAETLFDGDTEPNQAAVAKAFDRACANASGEFEDTCRVVFAQPPERQRQIIEEATPLGLDTQVSAAFSAASSQVQNIGARTSQLRSGQRLPALSQLGLSVRGEQVPVASLLDHRGGTRGYSRIDPDLAVADALARMRGEVKAAAQNTATPEPRRARRWGYFLNGQMAFGEKPSTIFEEGYDFDTRGLTTGVDYRVSSASFVGLALGYLDSDTEMFGNAGSVASTGYSGTLYSTWSAGGFFVDASATLGEMDLDLERTLRLPSPLNGQRLLTAVSETESEYETLTLGLGYDFRVGRGALTLFGRGNATEADVHGFTEAGASGFNLTVGDQNVESLLIEAGLEWVQPVSYRWGVLQPMIRVSHFHEAENDPRAIAAGFAFDLTGSQFLILTEMPDRDYLNVGAGLTFTLKRGSSWFVLYETDLERDDLETGRISVGFRRQF